jgi:hypothetical protein
METKNYTIPVFVLVVLVMISGFAFLNNKIQVSQHPTQDEWLEVYTSHCINESLDTSQQRVAFLIAIASKDANGKALAPKQMVITIASANGQDPISQNAKNGYIQTVENIAKYVLEDYRLNKEYEVAVQYVGE